MKDKKYRSRYIVIMAGGVGSRFWPSSTEEKPKQFLDILGIGRSLLQSTYDRCLHLVPNSHILIITNKRYGEQVAEQLPELPSRNILCEPTRNNTAPAIAYVALRLQAINREATFAVLPSDHVILKEQAYISCLDAAFDFAEENASIVTLGISPTRPDTGYGYIELDSGGDGETTEQIVAVRTFREKPTKDVAEEFISAGNYLWNAGMFVWSVATVLSAFEEFAPEVLGPLQRDLSKFASNAEQEYIDQVYPLTPSISVDYAILEKARNVYSLPCDIGWSDLGTWASLHNFLPHDKAGNVTFGRNLGLEHLQSSLIKVPAGKKVIVRGLEGYIVVDSGDALLIYPMEEEQKLKKSMQDLILGDYDTL